MAQTIHRHGRTLRRRENRLLLMRDLMDMQIESSDGLDLGRVDDVEALIDPDGVVRITGLLSGPQALAGRVSSRLQPLVRRILKDRFDSRIPMDEVAECGLVIKLKHEGERYRLGASERTLARLMAHIPGARRTGEPFRYER